MYVKAYFLILVLIWKVQFVVEEGISVSERKQHHRLKSELHPDWPFRIINVEWKTDFHLLQTVQL